MTKKGKTDSKKKKEDVFFEEPQQYDEHEVPYHHKHNESNVRFAVCHNRAEATSLLNKFFSRVNKNRSYQDVLIAVVDLTKFIGDASSGKSHLIASTGTFLQLYDFDQEGFMVKRPEKFQILVIKPKKEFTKFI